MSGDPNLDPHPVDSDGGPTDVGTPPTRETFAAGREPGTIDPDLVEQYEKLFGPREAK